MAADLQMALLPIMADGACRSSDVLAEMAGVPVRAANVALGKLLMRDYVERMERGCYQLTEAGRAAIEAGTVLTSAPLRPFSGGRKAKDTRRERLWRAIRARARSGSFTAEDLLPLAMTAADDEKKASAEASAYCHALAEAGILMERRRARRVTGRAPGAGAKTYVLLRDLGPDAPEIRRSKGVIWDPNAKLEIARAGESRGKDDLRARAWAILRTVTRPTSTGELVAMLDPLCRRRLTPYLRALSAAGVLARQDAATTNGETLWSLRLDLGVAAPTIKRDGTVISGDGQPVTAEEPDWMAWLRAEVATTGAIAPVARRIGISRPTLSQVLAGRYRSDPAAIAALAREAMAAPTVSQPQGAHA